jgi:hypothetical protein
MRVFAEALAMPKAGNSNSEYEDAFWPRRPVDGKMCSRFAVADGATETSFSGVWAKQLVRAYCAGFFDELPESEWLSRLRRKWWSIVRSKPLPWYAEQKIECGTFAAIVGLTLSRDFDREDRGTWHAEAIGDSCLFQLRETNLITKFPVQASQDFTNSPLLLSSRPDMNTDIAAMVSARGEWERGDSFYLMTDAVAAWFLRVVEHGGAPWEIIRDLDSERDKPIAPDSEMRSLREWVETSRREGSMRNDDVTVYRIEIV